MNGLSAVIKRHRADIIIIALILTAALLIYLFSFDSTGVTAEVMQNGKLIYSFELNKITQEQTLTLEGEIEILVQHNGISFVHSNCPDKICVKSGILTQVGQSAVCVPNRAVIRLRGSSNKAPDIISY